MGARRGIGESKVSFCALHDFILGGRAELTPASRDVINRRGRERGWFVAWDEAAEYDWLENTSLGIPVCSVFALGACQVRACLTTRRQQLRAETIKPVSVRGYRISRAVDTHRTSALTRLRSSHIGRAQYFSEQTERTSGRFRRGHPSRRVQRRGCDVIAGHSVSQDA